MAPKVPPRGDTPIPASVPASVQRAIDDVLGGTLVTRMLDPNHDHIEGAAIQLASGDLYLMIADRTKPADATPLVEVRIPPEHVYLVECLLAMAISKKNAERLAQAAEQRAARGGRRRR